MKHAELVSLAARFCRGYCKCRICITEMRSYAASEEPDVIGWSCARGMSVVIECKVSRADFRADAKKSHRRPGVLPPMGNQLWYATPAGLLRLEEVPAECGLVELGGDRARVLRKPGYRPTSSINIDGERGMLASLIRRITEHEGLAPLASWCLPTIGEDAVEEVQP